MMISNDSCEEIAGLFHRSVVDVQNENKHAEIQRDETKSS